jgi:AcrR family transcriptional regulator
VTERDNIRRAATARAQAAATKEQADQQLDIAITEAFRASSLTVGQIAEAAGVTRPTVYKAVERVQQEGAK